MRENSFRGDHIRVAGEADGLNEEFKVQGAKVKVGNSIHRA
jgi:hypothetical protein